MDFMAALMAKKLAGGGSYALPSATRTAIITGLPAFAMGIALDGSGNLWVGGWNGPKGLRKYVGFSSTLDANYDPTGDYRGVWFFDGAILASEYADNLIRSFNPATGVQNPTFMSATQRSGVCVIGNVIYTANTTRLYRHNLVDKTLIGEATWGTYGVTGTSFGAQVTETPDGNVAVLGSGGYFSILDRSDLSILYTLRLPDNTLGMLFKDGLLHSLDTGGTIYVHDTI